MLDVHHHKLVIFALSHLYGDSCLEIKLELEYGLDGHRGWELYVFVATKSVEIAGVSQLANP